MKGSRGTPSLMKRMVAALSSKTNELRTQIMIFFLLHKATNLLQFDSISHKLNALFTNVGGGVHRHHHHKKKNDEDLLGGGQEQHELLHQPEEAYKDEHGNNRKDQKSVVQLPAMYYYNNNRNNTNDELYVDCSRKAPGVSEITHVEEEEDNKYDHYNKLQEEMMVPKEEEEMDDDNIDQAADLFIKRFRQQIWLQKQLSSCEFNRSAPDTTTMIST